MELYHPAHLEAALQEIKKKHTRSGFRGKPYFSAAERRKQFRRLAELPPEDVEDAAELLTKPWLKAIAEYIGPNEYQLPLANLTRILYLRMDGEIFGAVFQAWLDRFGTSEIGILMSETVRKKKSAVTDWAKENGKRLTAENLSQWISALPGDRFAAGKEIMKNRKERQAFRVTMREFGVLEESTLGKYWRIVK